MDDCDLCFATLKAHNFPLASALSKGKKRKTWESVNSHLNRTVASTGTTFRSWLSPFVALSCHSAVMVVVVTFDQHSSTCCPLFAVVCRQQSFPQPNIRPPKCWLALVSTLTTVQQAHSWYTFKQTSCSHKYITHTHTNTELWYTSESR